LETAVEVIEKIASVVVAFGAFGMTSPKWGHYAHPARRSLQRAGITF
jgi:hypothetical protein